VHLIPNYQNPAGVTLSLEKRQILVSLAAEYGFVIFEDDPYIDIRFRGEPLPSMLSLDTRDVVVHASSFTKTVCPGVRVGYLVGPADLIARIAKTATNLYISPSMLSQATVYQFCVSGDIEESIKVVCTALAERARLLSGALGKYLPEAIFTEPSGGYFLWVKLPANVDVDKLLPAAIERGVEVVKGSDFLLAGGKSSLRLAYSAVTHDQVDEGVRRLAEAVRAVS
jgi:DNA-binding transcriptional MocR family regulator